MSKPQQSYQNKKFLEWYLVRHASYWLFTSLLVFFDAFVFNGFVLRHASGQILPGAVVVPIEISILVITFANSAYCLISYLVSAYSSFKEELFAGSVNSSARAKKSPSTYSAREDCVRTLDAFLGNFFKRPAIVQQRDPNTTLSSTISELDSKNSSLSSLVGYHDSPMNKFVTSVHSRSQLKEILDNENCDSVVDTADCSAFFTQDLGEGRLYKAGTSQYLSTDEEDTALKGIKSFMSQYEPPKSLRRTDKRIYHRTHSTGDLSTKVHIETDLQEILKVYELDEHDLDSYELKLRIWICNTIICPLIEKIDELNIMLAEKLPTLQLGSSSLEMLQNALSHKPDLCNTLIPFVLPYLRFHSNQQYIVNRIHVLGRNIALEDFKWSGGGDVPIRDESNSFNRLSGWNEQLPTDTALVWHLFATYMDFHLSPSSSAVSAVTDFSRPFANVYFVKSSTGEFPPALSGKLLQTALNVNFEKFFVRMISERPPNFEFVVDGGETIMLPMKDTPRNFWLVFTLFLAHIKKSKHPRIGNLHISTLSLDIFDA